MTWHDWRNLERSIATTRPATARRELPMIALRIDAAGPADAAALLRVLQQSFAEHIGRLDPPSRVHVDTEANVRADLELGGGLLARVGDDVVGCLIWRLAPDHVHGLVVGVLPAFRGRGVGGALMAALEGIGRSAGRTEARVAMREQLAANRRFYEGLGYRVVRRERHPRGSDMVLWLHRALSEAAHDH